MSLNRIKHNKHTIFVCTAMFVVFFYMIYHYQGQNNYHIVNIPEEYNNGTTTTEVIGGNSTTTATSTPVVKKPIPIGREVGIAAGSKLVGFSDEALESEMMGIVGLGGEWVRFDIEWGFVQFSSPLKYDWSKYDRIINVITKYNLKPLPILTYTPQWARVPGCRGGAKCPPADPKAFAEFASEAVRRYKKKNVHYWQIWNEPNSYDFWATKADCKAYTELLKVTTPAMKKIDPQAFIVTGGVAQVGNTDVNIAPLDFIECIYKNGGKNYFDAIGFHAYTFPNLPSQSINNGWGRMGLGDNSVVKIMQKYNDTNKKIWITEFGAPTGGPDPKWYLSEEKQAEYYEDAFKLYKKSDWAGPLFIYTYLDSGFEPTTNENFFGIVRFDGSFKPAYKKIQELINQGI